MSQAIKCYIKCNKETHTFWGRAVQSTRSETQPPCAVHWLDRVSYDLQRTFLLGPLDLTCSRLLGYALPQTRIHIGSQWHGTSLTGQRTAHPRGQWAVFCKLVNIIIMLILMEKYSMYSLGCNRGNVVFAWKWWKYPGLFSIHRGRLNTHALCSSEFLRFSRRRYCWWKAFRDRVELHGRCYSLTAPKAVAPVPLLLREIQDI